MIDRDQLLAEWNSAGSANRVRLPPDLTNRSTGQCGILLRWTDSDDRNRAWVCTRRTGHMGRHAAGDGHHIRAVWNG